LNFRQQLRGCYNMYEETVSIEPCLSNSLCVLIRCMATAELHQRTGPTCTFHLNNPTLGELGLVRLGVTLGAVHLAIVTAFVKANCTKLSSIGARNLCHRLLSHDIVSGWSVCLASGLRLVVCVGTRSVVERQDSRTLSSGIPLRIGKRCKPTGSLALAKGIAPVIPYQLTAAKALYCPFRASDRGYNGSRPQKAGVDPSRKRNASQSRYRTSCAPLCCTHS